MKTLIFFDGALLSNFRAKWIYRRGVARAKLRQNAKAIEDYTTVIEMTAAPAGIRAIAFYGRALVFHATSDESNAIRDLESILAMDGASEQIRTAARQKLVRMKRTSERIASREPNSTFRSQGGAHACT